MSLATISFTIRDEVDVETTSIRVHYDELIQSVDEGTLISLDNGLLNFKVLNKSKPIGMSGLGWRKTWQQATRKFTRH